MGNAPDLAARFLLALEAGDPTRELRRQFAELVIATGEDLVERGRAALDGPHAWRRAIELAEFLAQAPSELVDAEARS